MMKTILMMVLLTVATGHAKPNIVILFADDLDADEINCTLDRVNTWPTPNGALRVIGKGVKAELPKVNAMATRMDDYVGAVLNGRARSRRVQKRCPRSLSIPMPPR